MQTNSRQCLKKKEFLTTIYCIYFCWEIPFFSEPRHCFDLFAAIIVSPVWWKHFSESFPPRSGNSLSYFLLSTHTPADWNLRSNSIYSEKIRVNGICMEYFWTKMWNNNISDFYSDNQLKEWFQPWQSLKWKSVFPNSNKTIFIDF